MLRGRLTYKMSNGNEYSTQKVEIEVTRHRGDGIKSNVVLRMLHDGTLSSTELEVDLASLVTALTKD